MIDFGEVLRFLRPGEEWTLNNNDYEQLVWLSDTIKPSLAECQAAWDKIKDDIAFRPLRERRNNLLTNSDWTQMPDAPVDKTAWAEYRQALRDLPENTIDPENPIWPTRPDEGGE